MELKVNPVGIKKLKLICFQSYIYVEVRTLQFNYYQIINQVNNKKYIGITSKDFSIRWKEHIRLLKKNIHPNYLLQKDWNEYGQEAFQFEKIETLDCETIELGYFHEYELIQECQNKYNILLGGQINPMYTPVVRQKMIKTKQDQVPSIYQLQEISENVFKVIGIFNSQKEAARKTEADQGNIQHAITNHVKGCGYYWCNETSKEEFEANWRPARTKIKPCAELDSTGNIIKVHHNRSLFEKEYGWTTGIIKGAIARNGKAHGIKFINLTEDEYYKIKPITLIF